MAEHPENMEFEIDREKLTRYWRFVSMLTLILFLVPIGLLMGFTDFMSGFESRSEDSDWGFQRFWWELFGRIVVGILLGIVGSIAIYFCISHRQCRTQAMNVRLTVEGAFLRYRKGGMFQRDRKIHFRAVSDYSVYDGPLLRRMGLRSLGFNLAGIERGALIAIPAVVDAEKVRDLLCEVDAEREVG